MRKKGNIMIKMENLSYSFPQKDLYHQISFTLEEGQHCAFIGTSGSGKSTLMDIIMDPKSFLFEGSLELGPDTRIGFVGQFQNLEMTKESTVFEYISEDFRRLQNEISCICKEMEEAFDLEPLLQRYQNALDALEGIGGEDFESSINKKLNLAKLHKKKDLKVAALSGGEFKLIQVMREMLKKPNLMILDEPDVFLDFENLNSLKNLIHSYKGSLLIVTHNRYLLNHCFNKIIHLENKELQEFNGRYVDYTFSLLQRKIELQELALEDTAEIERNDIIIDNLRHIATYNTEASRGKALKARVKIQERLEARRIKAPFVYIKQPNIHLEMGNKTEESTLLSVNDYSIVWDALLLEKVNFEIQAGDKVALIGPNGSGKTTLLKEIFRNQKDSIGLKEGAQVAYLSQLQGEMLQDKDTIFETFFEEGFKSYVEIIAYLSNYGFEEEVLGQKIGALSGGERKMLQLALVCGRRANLLLLDEPSSHLDTYSQIALEKAIQDYPGAVLMSSHDYYTIVNCMDYVLILENKTLRKMSIRKFRKLIYGRYFNQGYLEVEQKKKSLELKIELALKELRFEGAKSLSKELEDLIQKI